ncbi:MAG: hypothetical protein KC912_04700 [Proteobacteria bacterium]|nr:hypothetical protein [Pseudomonadota bacterium]
MTRSLLLILLAMGCTPEFTPIDGTTLGEEDSGPDLEDSGLVDTEEPDTGNFAPLADAGPDQDVGVTDVVDLDGSASFDEDGDTLAFSWEFVSTPSASGTSIINSGTESPSFWADTEGTFVVELTVDDGTESATDTVEITATAPNDIPIAYAGADQSVNEGDTVQLNGTGSYDPDGDSLTYAWRFVSTASGSGASLSSTTSASPRFTADVAGNYTVELVVNDGTFSSTPDTVRIVAQAADDGDCLSCGAQAEQELRRRARLGDYAGGPAMILLPFFALAFYRRED